MASIIDDLKAQYQFGGIIQKLIYWNIGCFLVSLVFFYQFKGGGFHFPNWIALSSTVPNFIIKPWTFLSYAFFHHGFGHIFFNMIILNFSGNLFLTFFNQKQLLGLYLLSAVFAGIVFVGSFFMMNMNASMVGASGAIMAVLVAITTYNPLMSIRLLLIGNVKLWQLTLVVLVIDLMQLRLENSGGHIAHLAGAFFGFVFIKLLKNGTDLSKIVSVTIDFFVNLFSKSSPTKQPFRKVHKNYKAATPERPTSRVVIKDKQQQQIDEILDKISRSGYDCLTKEEKEFLFKAGK